ncbi:SDR family oxidoreductase [Hoeflea prorocentri]|uniref:SDR family oxidoreductase n=1 Tax=Hoeflea prorocentri TaxID=1922333 RepID=A0A9X3ZHK3_9HYPH|nr:SDR family oxidoreductase [Hoeflea prorocentri]MCY6381434.1 SDR family oxidoreductase [Hoeflea prorocentri]MDA5399234.1 SDR family oxidoreductase [Hoeflea prorocentri]
MAEVAIITGAGRGIGAATAVLAARQGYDICINYVSDEKSASRVVKDCIKSGVRAIAVKADIASSAEVDRLFEACVRQLGAPTLLVNNAGIIGGVTTVEALSDAVLQRVFEVNVFGAFYCARAAIRGMSTQTGGKGGVIVNISSLAATLGSPGEYVHYAASKAAIDAMTIGLSKEVGRHGIRVNAVQAGTVETDIHRTEGNPHRPVQTAKASPLGRAGTPKDIAEAVLWLASEKAGYATGTVLRVAGGL